MKKLLTVLLILSLLITSSFVLKADMLSKYVVTASCLNVRQGPGTHSAVVGGLLNGTVIDGGQSANGWTPIAYGGACCYVYSKYLRLYEIPHSHTPNYTQSDLDLLARVVNAEAGSSHHTDEHQRAVASVVMNRVSDSRFPSTIREVVYQSGQYACTWDGSINKTPTQRAIDNAKYVLENGVTTPTNVVWQSQAKQGKGIWKHIQGHYFCY